MAHTSPPGTRVFCRALRALPVVVLTACPRVSLPSLDKAARFDPGAERGRTPSEDLPMDHVDARITSLASGQRAVAWSTCDAGGCEARVGYLEPGEAGAPAEVAWSQALRLPDGALTGVRIEGIREADLDDDGEGEVVVVLATTEGDRVTNRRVSIYDPVGLRLVSLLELERGRPAARSCTLYVVDVNADQHRDLVMDCSDSARPKIRTWRRARDEWR